jgi:LmbE family N-acetylglucosaminyl deacetylase
MAFIVLSLQHLFEYSFLYRETTLCQALDNHLPDHRKVGKIVSGSVQKAAIGLQKKISLYTCDTYKSLTLTGQVPGRAIVNIDAEFDLKMRALSEHRSQLLEHFAEMARRHSRVWGARIGAKWGEAFDPVVILCYSRSTTIAVSMLS